jgi:hypothetical protein
MRIVQQGSHLPREEDKAPSGGRWDGVVSSGTGCARWFCYRSHCPHWLPPLRMSRRCFLRTPALAAPAAAICSEFAARSHAHLRLKRIVDRPVRAAL